MGPWKIVLHFGKRHMVGHGVKDRCKVLGLIVCPLPTCLTSDSAMPFVCGVGCWPGVEMDRPGTP